MRDLSEENGDMVPNVPPEEYKRTKIVATLGPATYSYEAVRGIITAGANCLRLNFSHGSHEQHAQLIRWVRQAAQALGKPVAIIQDLQGPKIRLGDFDETITVTTGQELQLGYRSGYENGGIIPVQYDLANKVKPGERLYIYDGKIRTTVSAIKDGVVYVQAENDGILLKRKGINLPDTDFGGDIITAKDREDLAFGATQDIDYVAQSFVQTAEDLRSMRKLMETHNMNAKLIVKFETKAAIDNIEEVVQEADVVMIARGDLAVETPPESIPIVQRRLVGLGLRYAKPTIVATQMLLSMTESPEPTRAEISDVATAVLMGADCVMLSEETAAGKYPIEAVRIMKRAICYTERHSPLRTVYEQADDMSWPGAIASGVISLAQSINARVIIAETKSGTTALRIAARRPDTPLIAVTSDRRTAQQLTMVHGVKTFFRSDNHGAAQKLADQLKHHGALQVGDTVVIVTGRVPGLAGTTDTVKIVALD